MTNPLITELNCETGQAINRPMTDSELADFDKIQAEQAAIKTKEAEAKAAKVVAQTKLAELGLSADDLKALGL